MSQVLQSPSVLLEVAIRDLLASQDRGAAGIIAASGRGHTPAEAIEVQQQVLRTMFPPEQ